MAVIRPFKTQPAVRRGIFNEEFADYVWYRNLFSPEEVEKIRSLWSDDLARDAEVNNAGEVLSRDDLRKSNVMFIRPQGNEWIYDRLSLACLQANSNRYKFEIQGFQTELQLAKYEDGGFFDWHMDFGAGDISNRKLSITVQLCDDEEYEGGELQFMINQNIHTAPRDKGTAVIFPSFGLHRVMPVKSGCRMSIVGWIAGPPYR